MLIVSWYIGSMLFFYLYDYLFTKIINGNKYVFSLKNFIYGNIMALINICLLYYNMGYLRPYIIHIYFILTFKSLYKCSVVKTLLGVLYIMAIVFISELIFGFIMVLLFKVDISNFNNNWINYIFSNVMVYGIATLALRIPICLKLIDNIIMWYNENEYKSLMIFIIFCSIIMTFLLYNNFISYLPPSLLWVTNMFCIGVFVFVIGFFKEKTNNNKIIYEYDQLLDYVKVYEKLLEEKSKNQHEYKNQLILIRDTSRKNDRVNYINDLLNVKDSTEDSEWLNKLKYIPQGGLKGLIYYKIQMMLKNKVSVFLTVSEELKDLKNWKNFDKNLSDISKVIGVYLDNAIEAVNDSKEKYIIISVYLEKNNIIFEISNTYKGNIDMSKIDKEGYSTKGNGKGYGLSLVKDIINKNDNLEQKRILNGIYYVQQLYIKK